MQVRLTIQERLQDLRKERKLTQLEEQTDIPSSTLEKYEADDYKDISPFNIVTLAKFYVVSTNYLVGLTEQKNHPDTDPEDLHLSDAMIELLNVVRSIIVCFAKWLRMKASRNLCRI